MQMFVDVGGVKLFCEKTGAGSPIILLHGSGEDHGIFDTVVPSLAEHFTVYAVDSRGHGRSTPAEHYDYRQMAGDIYNLIQVLHLEKPAVLGFSDGGILGLLLAIDHPDLLDRLVVCGANANPQGLSVAVRTAIKANWMLTRDGKQELMLTQPCISREELESIRVPVLVLAGERDMVRPAHTRAIAQAIPGARLLVLPGQSHASYVVHSDLLYPAVQGFLLHR